MRSEDDNDSNSRNVHVNEGSVIDVFTLRTIRQERGLDQKALADKANIDPSILSRLERGLQTDLKASILVAIARALNVSIESLLSGEARPEPKETSIDYLKSLDLIPELGFAVRQLVDLPNHLQHHIAALLQAYLTNLPDITTAEKLPTYNDNNTPTQLQESPSLPQES